MRVRGDAEQQLPEKVAVGGRESRLGEPVGLGARVTLEFLDRDSGSGGRAGAAEEFGRVLSHDRLLSDGIAHDLRAVRSVMTGAACFTLLHDVGQLVREEMSPGRGVRDEAIAAEGDVAPHGVGARLDRARRLGRLLIRVRPHVSEVAPEARLHEGARLGVERAARRGQHFADDGRGRLALSGINRLNALGLHALLRLPRLLLTLTLRAPAAAACAGALQRRPGRAHDLICDAVCVLLQVVVGRVHGQAGGGLRRRLILRAEAEHRLLTCVQGQRRG